MDEKEIRWIESKLIGVGVLGGIGERMVRDLIAALRSAQAEIDRLNVVIETLAHYENEPGGVAQNTSSERLGSPQTGEGV
jgi:hypothetical protein